MLVTLDTGCVSALANPSATDDPKEVVGLGVLIDRYREGSVQLQLTGAYERDFDRDTNDARRAERLEWLEGIPPMERAPAVFRSDVSISDGPDVLGRDSDSELDKRLRALLEPVRSSQENLDRHADDPAALAYLLSDIDHLMAHSLSGADLFATLDKGILGKRSGLANLGIAVALPTEVVAGP